MAQPADSFLLDLADTLACQIEFSPISSNVISEQPMPKKYLMMSRSRSVSVSKARSTSVESDSLISPRSALGESGFTSTSSSELSSPSANGASTET